MGAVDRLLQARARREVPGPARQVLEGHEARRRLEEVRATRRRVSSCSTRSTSSARSSGRPSPEPSDRSGRARGARCPGLRRHQMRPASGGDAVGSLVHRDDAVPVPSPVRHPGRAARKRTWRSGVGLAAPHPARSRLTTSASAALPAQRSKGRFCGPNGRVRACRVGRPSAGDAPARLADREGRGTGRGAVQRQVARCSPRMTRAGSHGGQANIAVVPVPDPRLQVLTDMESLGQDRRRAGAVRRRAGRRVERAGHREAPRGRRARGRAAVLRRRRLARWRSSRPCAAELLLADLARDRERAGEGREEGARGKPGPEVDALRRAKEALEAETPLRDARRDRRGRGAAARHRAADAEARGRRRQPGGRAGGSAGARRRSARSASTRRSRPRPRRWTPTKPGRLLEEFGVSEPGLETVIAASYRALDLITFLTTGEDETRAWEVRRGAKAPEAAGVIHTRPGARLHPRGGDRLRRTGRGRFDGGREGRRQAAPRRQGLRGGRGRHPQHPLQRLGARRGSPASHRRPPLPPAGGLSGGCQRSA